jgi:hypothetical protein
MELTTILLLAVLVLFMVSIARPVKSWVLLARRVWSVPGPRAYPLVGNLMQFMVPHNRTYLQDLVSKPHLQPSGKASIGNRMDSFGKEDTAVIQRMGRIYFLMKGLLYFYGLLNIC